MPRGRRVLVEGGLYHVYNRFARGEDVFVDPEEAVEFSELLREVKQRDGLTVYAWALLSNHYHIAVRTSAVPLSRSMQRLQGGFEPAWTRARQRSGRESSDCRDHGIASCPPQRRFTSTSWVGAPVSKDRLSTRFASSQQHARFWMWKRKDWRARVETERPLG